MPNLCRSLGPEGWGSNISPAEDTYSPSARKSAPDGMWDIMFPGKIEKVAATLYPTTMLFCTISWLIVYIFVAKLEAPMARTLASVSLHPFTPSTVFDEGKEFYKCRLLNCNWLDRRVTGFIGNA